MLGCVIGNTSLLASNVHDILQQKERHNAGLLL